ncbi:MAG: M48 family metalloprotease [Pseudomonadales bacterium]
MANLRTAFALTCLISTVMTMFGCAVNPATGGLNTVLMSEKKEIEIGKENHEELLKKMPIYNDPEITAYVNSVGQKLAANSHRSGLNYSFTVIDSPDINAFALPGGFIYINRGLLTYLNSEAQLAAVLGHEIGHVTARHSVRQHSAGTAASIVSTVLAVGTGSSAIGDLSNVAGAALVSGYGRDHELEADSLGAEYLYKSGYDPQAMVEVISILKDQEQFAKYRVREEGGKVQSYHGLFASHPRNDTRLQEVVGKAGKLAETQKQTFTGTFREHIEGIEFGESDNQGIRRGSRFYHKPMNFSLAFPSNWKLQNSPNSLVAYPTNQTAFLQMQVQGDLGALTPESFIKTRLKIDNLKEGEVLEQYGLRGYTGTVAATEKRGPVRVAVIFHKDQAFYFSGVNRMAKTKLNFDPFFLASIKSFRPMNPDEFKLAAGMKIKYIRATAATSYASLAQNSKIEKYAEQQLRLLNGDYPRGEPEPGRWIKIVE